jgi:signal peptidase I
VWEDEPLEPAWRPDDRAEGQEPERGEEPPPAAPLAAEAPSHVAASLPQPPPVRVGAALLACLVAALAAAVAWGLAARWTGSEVAIAAWGLGLLCGAVAGVAGGRRGDLRLLGVAWATTLLGIVVGTYLEFAFLAQLERDPAPGLFSAELRSSFRDGLDGVVSEVDVLWIGLGLVSAWWVLRPQKRARVARAEHEDEQPPRVMRGNPVDRLTAGLPHGWRVTIDWAVTIVGAVAIVLVIKAWVVNPYRIPSSSMEPTLHCAQPAPGCEARFSDRVLANRFIYHFTEPKRGDIVVFDTPPEARVRCGAGGTFVKRLIGLPGERIDIKVRHGDAYVYVNGKELDEPYIEPGRRDHGPERTFTVPAGHYFMMGDNRSQSCDSRVWGAVPRENLIGKVFATYWPPNRIGFR